MLTLMGGNGRAPVGTVVHIHNFCYQGREWVTVAPRVRRQGWKAPAGWQATRRRVLARDGYLCRVCEAKVGKGGRRAHVHHLLGRRENRDFDLVTLCATCHEVVTLLAGNAKALVLDRTGAAITTAVAFARTYLSAHS